MPFTELVFEVNGLSIVVQERRPGVYWGYFQGWRRKYRSRPDAHKAVLLSFLDDLAKAGRIDERTANWPENEITIVN